jgi:predicted Zn-dependent protease
MKDRPMSCRIDRRQVIAGLLATAAAPLLQGCETNEALGRDQLMMVSDAQLAQASATSWSQYRQKKKVSPDPVLNRRLRDVGQRIVSVSGLPPMNWEFAVFEDDAVNAFVLPGGKMGFNTGIMKLMSNDDQLATVVGHETSHVIGRHAAERASQSQLTGLGMLGLSLGLQAGNVSAGADWAQLFGMGVQYGVLLPYSRQHETEADTLGVRLMHRAGYNAREAVPFWEKMAVEARKRPRPPEFMSTHPSDQTRIDNIRRVIATLATVLPRAEAEHLAALLSGPAHHCSNCLG